MEQKRKCTRLGCHQEYYEKDNTEQSCSYHDGKPMFHDIKKGWTCCQTVVYDWDEFNKIKGCKVGRHTDDKAEKVEFFKSSAVANAQQGIDKEEAQKTKVWDINAFNKEQQQKEDERRKNEPEKPKEIIKTKEGKYYCGNPGCASKTYDPEQNEEGSCKHHLGQPVFHDRKKFWSCCKQESYDWDDFEKLAPCAVSKHTPKYKK